VAVRATPYGDGVIEVDAVTERYGEKLAMERRDG
jgi:hypothetical protein